MSVSELHLHGDFLQACIEGDLNHVLQLAYYHTDIIQSLIQGDMPCMSADNEFPGAFQPGEYVHAVCMLGHCDLVAQLINLGADPSADSRFGTPLDIACKNGKLDVIRLLHTSGVDLHPDDKEIWDSAIYTACRNGHDDIVQYILSSKPELLSHRTEGFADGCILFYEACEHGWLSIVKLLTEKGVDINNLVYIRDGSLSLPLDAACTSGSYELIDYLMLQHIEIPRTIVEKHPHMFAPAFQSMMKKYSRPMSLKGIQNQGSTVRNTLFANWSEKNIAAIHESWFGLHGPMIQSIDLHRNKLTELPDCFFEMLPNLEDLDISVNLLACLPERGIDTCKLSRLIASRNNLHSVPLTLFKNKTICRIDLFQNKLKYLPPDGVVADLDSNEYNEEIEEELWGCINLASLKLSQNQLAKLPKAIHGACKLERLNLANNELISFVSPWNCRMDDLDLSCNHLTSFEENIDVYWSKSMRRLTLSGNKLTAISWSVCRLENLSILDLSHNMLESLPPRHYWLMKGLNKLNLSYNRLSASCGPEGFADVEKQRVEIAMSSAAALSFISNCELPVDMFENTLQSLDLSDNNLEMVPETVCMLTALGELNLSNNPRIKRLPAELGKLRNIWNLKLDNLSLQDLPQDLRGPGTAKKTLALLRAKLRKSVPFKRMKLMVVGLEGRGKTTLLATLQRKRPPAENVATVGISVEQWTLQPNANQGRFRFWASASPAEQEIVFSTWDLAGQHVYYATHQCFLTSNTLYLVVWNVQHGKEGIDRLAPWLLNIQARAPKCQVIVVGTHLDKLPQSNRKEHLSSLTSDLFKKFGKKGFPCISGNVFISNTTEEGLQNLRDVIYKVASKMQDSNLHEPMIGKKVPLSYLQLYDAVTKEADRRATANEPPILTSEEFLQLAKDNPDNDILDQDELNQAARFLHDHGVLLHYNDHIRGLNNLYFIDPSWLCDMIALVVTVRQKNPFVKDGYIKVSDIDFVLNDPRLPEGFRQQYLQILERFEIALRLDDERILIPSMLPRERPSLLMEDSPGSQNGGSQRDRLSKLVSLPRGRAATERSLAIDHVLRNYHLGYVPAGFWSRLIARLIIAVHKWGMIISDQEVDEQETDEQLSNYPPAQKGVTLTKNYSMIYWREGILVIYEMGKFLIESFTDHYEDLQYGNEGVSITVKSDFGDFSVMGFIVDQIDRLISEWYPGLEDLDEYGMMTVQRMIPCPTCAMRFKKGKLSKYLLDSHWLADFAHHFRNPEFVKQFSLTVCAMAAVNHEELQCSMHLDEPVPLAHLVPDLLMSDLPHSLTMDKRRLDFDPSDDTRLGSGGAGEVYKARYDGHPIAVKRFHSTVKSRHLHHNYDSDNATDTSAVDTTNSRSSTLYIPTEQSICDQLEEGKVIKSFWELRQEVAVLCRLQHPCIIKLLGVCRIPLCFGLELAPKGGLYSILEDIAHERDLVIQANPNNPPCMESVLGRKLTYKIALQVAHALLYLHDSEIVYRDLKSDNVLVWSLDETATVNVKLSDYGISCFATPQGVVGEGGTPGFQAPEVRTGCAYDEKVDIFSFAIWLYELLTGYRPFRENRTSAEIRKAVHSGARPSLQNVHVDSKMPFLEALMQDCWVNDPESRPPAFDIIQRMEDPRFLCLRNSFPKVSQNYLEHVTCLLPLGNEGQDLDILPEQMTSHTAPPVFGDKLLLWCGDKNDRRFVIMDTETGSIQNDIPSPGPRVLCAVIVGQRIWLGTEGCQIDVFGRYCWQIPRILWSIGTKGPVLDLLVENGNAVEPHRIFASLANGTLLVFQRQASAHSKSHRQLQRLESQEELDRVINMERNEWGEPTVVYLANEGKPAKSLVLTKGGKELWVASGNCIAIVDVQNLQLVHQIRVFTLHRYMITQLVTDGERVWSIDRKSTNIHQWDVETRQKVFKFDCDISGDAARGVVVAEAVSDRLFNEITDSPPMSPRTGTKNASREGLNAIQEDQEHGDATQKDIEPADANTPVLDRQANGRTSREDMPALNVLKISPLLTKMKRSVQPSFLLSRKKRKTTKKTRSHHREVDVPPQTRGRSWAYTDSNMRIGQILLVGDTLWVGRSVGDILVLNIQRPKTKSVATSVSYSESPANMPFVFGVVLCQLSDEQGKQSGLLKEITMIRKVGDDRIVTAMRTESKMDRLRSRRDSSGSLHRQGSSEQVFDQFKLLTFEAWRGNDLQQFSAELSALHRLEQQANG